MIHPQKKGAEEMKLQTFCFSRKDLRDLSIKCHFLWDDSKILGFVVTRNNVLLSQNLFAVQNLLEFCDEAAKKISVQEKDFSLIEQHIAFHVHGEIESVEEDGRQYSVGIYISPQDNHTIYAPVDGKIAYIEPNKYQVPQWEGDIFRARPNAVESLTVMIGPITFSVEVGKPVYITDRIKFWKNQGEFVNKGEEIGFIVLGSRGKITVNKVYNGRRVRFTPDSNRRGNRVVGGGTILGRIEYQDSQELPI